MFFNFKYRVTAPILLGCIIICTATIISCEYPTDFERDVFKDPASELFARGPENIRAVLYQNSDLEHKGRIIQVDWSDNSDTKIKSSLWRKDGNGLFEKILEADINRINHTYFDTVSASQTYTYKVITDYEGDFQKQVLSTSVETFDWVLLPERNNPNGYLFGTREGNILSIWPDGMEVYEAGQNSWRVIGNVPCPTFVSIPTEMTNSDIFLLCANADNIIEAFILGSESLEWEKVGRMQRLLSDYSFFQDEYIKPVELKDQLMILFGFKRNQGSSDEILAELLDLKTGSTTIVDRSPMTDSHYQVVSGIAFGVQLNDNEVFVDYQFNALNSFVINLDTYQWNRTQQRYTCGNVSDIKKLEENRLLLLCRTYYLFHTIYDHNARGWTDIIMATDSRYDLFKIHETLNGNYFLNNRAGNIIEYRGEQQNWFEHVITTPTGFQDFDFNQQGRLLKNEILVHSVRSFEADQNDYGQVAILNISELGLF